MSSVLQPQTQIFGNPQPPTNTPFGDALESNNPFCDPSDPFYDPDVCAAMQGTGGGTTTTSGGGTVNVSVLTNIALVNNIGAELANAISAAMENAADQASVIAQNTANTVTQAVNNSVGGIVQGVNSAFGTIGDFFKNLLSSVASGLGDLFKSLASNIGDIVGKIADVVSASIKPIVSAVADALSTIQQINAQFIQPITTLILQTLQTVGTLTQVIETDLHNGLQGILQLPTDIANGLGSLDATLSRTMDQLGIHLDSSVGVNLSNGSGDSIWTRLKGLGDTLTSNMSGGQSAIRYTDHVNLPEPNIVTAGAATVDALWSELSTVVSSILNGGKNSLDGMKTALPTISAILGITAEGPAYIAALLGAAVAVFFPFFSFVKNDMFAKTGLEKLGAGDALEAYRRGFITLENMSAELAVNGYDAQRIQVLLDNAVPLIEIAAVLDMRQKNIVSDDQARQEIKQYGYTDGDVQALIDNSYRRVSVTESEIAFKWALIEESQLDDVYRQNGYTDEQLTLAKSVLFSFESSDNVILRERLQAMYQGFGFTPDAFNVVPDELSQAVRREGAGAQVATDKWQASYWVPPLQYAVELYFRGVRTQKELFAVFDYYAVPIQFRDDILQVHRALIPWRTIPTMVANGVISEAYAKQQLQAHGFNLTDTEAMLKFAELTHAKQRTQVSGDPLQTSVSTAHELWSIGAFTDEEYEETLTHHGFTQAQAQQIVASQRNHQSVLDRKQLAADIANEVLAGFITVDQAKSQMSQQSFTIAEQARVLKTIARTQKTAAKLPSVAELLKFTKARAITFERFKEVMTLLGYSPEWITAYAVLDLPADINGGLQLPTAATFS